MDNLLTIKKIVEICQGELFSGDENLECISFTKDTRTLREGDVYIGIKGEKFDGNAFYQDAFSKGASAAILEKNSFDRKYDGDRAIVLVEDSIEALRLLGMFKRDNTPAHFVGVTGSVGKTSTRDLIYSVVSESFKSLKTEGNFNNNIGLPLTLLRLQDEEAAVIEMGMNALGEIDYLSRITRPEIAVITNVGTAHIGELGSRENILKAKLEIINGLVPDGKLVIDNDNDMLHSFYLKNKKNVVTVGIENESDFMATDINMFTDRIEFDIQYSGNKYPIVCPVPNKVFVYNCLIAFAIGTILDIDVQKIKTGISSFKLTNNRSEIFKTNTGLTVIDDAYNANADSMKAGVETLKNVAADRKIAILGSMLELGDFSEGLHREVGKAVAANEIDLLLTVGEEAKSIGKGAIENGMPESNIFSFETNEQVKYFLRDRLDSSDTILVKASHSLHFNEIIDFLKEEF